MKLRIQTLIQISNTLKIPFNKSLDLMASLHDDDVNRVIQALRQILELKIEALELGAILDILNTLFVLINAEHSHPQSNLVLSRCENLNFSLNNESDELKIFQSAALKIIEVVLEKIPNQQDKITFLDDARKQDIFSTCLNDPEWECMAASEIGVSLLRS